MNALRFGSINSFFLTCYVLAGDSLSGAYKQFLSFKTRFDVVFFPTGPSIPSRSKLTLGLSICS